MENAITQRMAMNAPAKDFKAFTKMWQKQTQREPVKTKSDAKAFQAKFGAGI